MKMGDGTGNANSLGESADPITSHHLYSQSRNDRPSTSAAPSPQPTAPPKSLRRSGKALWRAVTRDFDLEEHELVLLREACRTSDSLDDLQALLEREGLTTISPQGVRVHPALVELRQQRIAFARIMTALRVPTGEDSGREQVRGGVRGVYGLGGGK